MILERGFDKKTIPELFMLLSEEIGEMPKSVRQFTMIKNDPLSTRFNLVEEMADVFILLLDIANHFMLILKRPSETKKN